MAAPTRPSPRPRAAVLPSGSRSIRRRRGARRSATTSPARSRAEDCEARSSQWTACTTLQPGPAWCRDRRVSPAPGSRSPWSQRAPSADSVVLLEKMVASDALGPISDREAGSLEAAYEPTQKVSEVLRIVHQRLAEQFDRPWGARLRWSAEGSFLNFIGANFRATGELAGVGGPLTYGLRSEEGSAKWFIALRQGSATRSSADIVRVTADQAGSARDAASTSLSNWERPQVGPTIAEITVRATALDSRQGAIDWIQGGLRELSASGVVEVLLGPLVTAGPIASPDMPGDGSAAIEPEATPDSPPGLTSP